jgi:hypothetical protein
MARKARVLYFIKGVNPTAADYSAAEAVDAVVSFRNALVVPEKGAGGQEIADGVMGEVPDAYDDYPTADEAIANVDKLNKAEMDRFGEKPAPTEAQKCYCDSFKSSDPGNPMAKENEKNGPTAIGGPAAAKAKWGMKARTSSAFVPGNVQSGDSSGPKAEVPADGAQPVGGLTDGQLSTQGGDNPVAGGTTPTGEKVTIENGQPKAEGVTTSNAPFANAPAPAPQ